MTNDLNLDSATNFICYLIDNCEGKIITEEMLRINLGRFIAAPQYSSPVKPSTMSEQVKRAQEDFIKYGLDRL